MSACHGFEKVFSDFHDCHESGIDTNPDVILRLHVVLLKKFPSWPEDLLLLFVKTRTFIRIKYLNHQLKAKEAKANLRNLKQISQFQC